MLPDNLDHLRVGWRAGGSYETAWVTPGHDCLCPYRYGRGAAERRKTNDAIWDGVIGLWCRVEPLLSRWCARVNVPTGVNLNQYSGSGSCVPWHTDNESLFGPPNQLKLIVSMSLGHSVVFQVRRVQGYVPSSMTLDHGDLLVMDGSAQSEYAHRTVPGLEFPRVSLTFCSVTQHAASCSQAGVVGCVLPMCVQGLAEPSFGWGEMVLLLLILVSFLLVSTWIHIRRGASSQLSASNPPGGAPPLWGSCSLGRRTALATVTTPPISQKSFSSFPLCFLVGEKTVLFFKSMVLFFWILLDMLAAEREPHSMLP